MIQQLEDTIKHDCDTTWYIKQLAEIEVKLRNINVNEIRFSQMNSINKNIEYYLSTRGTQTS
jgi:hypothetical protein